MDLFDEFDECDGRRAVGAVKRRSRRAKSKARKTSSQIPPMRAWDISPEMIALDKNKSRSLETVRLGSIEIDLGQLTLN